MARIRTIKPEFPQSESMGRVSRDARLLFIMLWTIADDSGRLRGNSRMLASLLFPYDDDAKSLIDGWIEELSSQGCLAVYMVGNDTYVEICNWLNHQKIDRPSRSKIPAFSESSRILANPRECSSWDQGSRTEGSRTEGLDLSASPSATDATKKDDGQQKGSRLTKDWKLPDSWTTEATAIGVPVGAVHVEADKFRDYWAALPGSKGVKLDWEATWRNWCRKAVERYRPQPGKPSKHDLSQMDYSKGADADGKF